MSRRALLIGVGRYDHYPSLAATVDGDLDRVEAALRNAGVRDVTRLGGARVTRTELWYAIAAFIEKAPDGADLLIYFTGHGQSAGGVTYLVPSNAVTDVAGKKKSLVEAAFDEEVTASRARSVSFVIDACRTPLDGEPAADSGQPPERPRTTVVYACAPGGQAATLLARDGASLFTEAFAELVEAAGRGVPLSELKARLQERTEQKGRQASLAQIPRVDVWAGTELESAPFAFFRAGRSTPPGKRWSALLSPDAADLGFTGSAEARFAEVCGRLDEIEAAAPSIDEPLLRVLPDQTLPERLTRAAALVLSRCCASDGEQPVIADADRLLVLAVTAALEASARAAELAAAKRTAARWRDAAGDGTSREQAALTRLAVIAPQFARVYPALPADRQRLLEAWCDRVLSLREAIGKPGTLRGHIARLLPRVYGRDPSASVDALTRYLTDRLYEEFIGRESDTSGGEARRGPQEVLAPRAGSDPAVLLDGRRVAALVRLTWLLSGDVRLLGPELGLTLGQDATSPAEALHPLADLTWVPAGTQVIDLRLRTAYAPLDRALRQLTEEITAFLTAASQSGMPLYGLDLPRAATATRLKPALRDGEEAFRLPHLRFEASAVETTELLMGTNLYGDAHVAIRELYQNAVDACLYRDWRIRNIQNASSGRAYSGWRASYEPEIVFSSGRDERGAWLECQDNGVGMSEYELRESFAKIGKRFRDLPEFLEEAEEWGDREDIPFRPISQFGIGVLSYFMLASEVELRTTRSDDRHSRLGEQLVVKISDATGIFRFERPQGPPAAGTTIRLYLREEFAPLNLLSALAQVIAAPMVRTRLLEETGVGSGKDWEPGRIYAATGSEIPAFGVKKLGVHFHEGQGRVLVNGIPLNALGGMTGASTGLSGVTISLDARSRPRLSVDRSRLLSADLDKVRELLVSAAGAVAGWPQASISWLLALFRTDPDAGSAAYRALASAGQDLFLKGLGATADVDEYPWEFTDTSPQEEVQSAQSDAILLPTSRIGVSVFDNDIGLRPSAKEWRETEPWYQGIGKNRQPQTLPRLAAERRRMLWSKAGRQAGAGFPVFDDRLIRLLSRPRLGRLQDIVAGSAASRVTPFPLPSPSPWPELGESIHSESPPDSWGEAVETALRARTTVGSVVVFAWAVHFLSFPVKIALPRLVAAFDRLPHVTAADIACDGFPLFASAADGPLLQLRAFLPLLDGQSEQAELVAAVFPEPESREYAAAYWELPPLAREQLWWQLSARSRNSDPQIFPQLEGFAARFPDAFERDNLAPLPTMPAPGRREQPPDVIAAARALSDPARWAVSKDLDGESPYYRKDEPIPAIVIALAAARGDYLIAPEEIREELIAAGYHPVRLDYTEAVRAVADELLMYLAGEGAEDLVTADSRVSLPDDLNSLSEITSILGPAKVTRIARVLHEAGFDADSTRRIAQLGTLRYADLEDIASILTGSFPLTVDALSLIRLADRRSATFGESLATLARHRPLSDPDWHLPGRLPAELAERRPSETELGIAHLADRSRPYDWRELAVRACALSGQPLGDLGDGIRPLLSACGERTEELDQLCAAWPGPVTFDDLLILGCLQTWPDLGPDEIEALCRPWCRWPGELAGRVGSWLRAAPDGAARAWTKGQS